MFEMNFGPYLQVLPNILIAFVIGILITPVLKKIGLRHGFATKGRSEISPDDRGYITRLDEKTISRLGEFAMLIPLLILIWSNLNLTTQVFGIVMTIFLVGIFGALDSKYHLSEFVKLFILIFSAILLIFTGTVIDINSLISLGDLDKTIFNPISNSQLSIFSALVTIAWVIIIPTAVSYVGGIDGLSEGTSAIAILIFLLIGIRTGDPLTITIASLSLGGLLGLLPYNFYPKVIMSEHLIYGYLIAILSIVSQAKIPTAILILTIPIIDFIYVCFMRSKRYFRDHKGKRFNLRLFLNYLGTPEKNHLHHKLLGLGFGHAEIALIQYFGYGILGLIALSVSGLYLTFAILGSIAIVVLIFYYINRKLKKNATEQ
jgi:UDP-GlcNAc:undecaprenyl-phosphate GlcNAc-1-phosphate transferase